MVRIGIAGFIWSGVIFLALVAVIGSAAGTAIEETAGAIIRNEAREAAVAALREVPGNKQEDAPAWPARVQSTTRFVQSLVTIIALVFGSFWAFYTFVIGRGIAPAVAVEMEAKDVVRREDKRFVVVSVTVKNVGRGKLESAYVQARIVPFDPQGLEPILQDTLLTRPLVPAEAGPDERPRLLFVGTEIADCEPGQEATEDLLVSFGDARVLTLQTEYVGWAQKIWPQ